MVRKLSVFFCALVAQVAFAAEPLSAQNAWVQARNNPENGLPEQVSIQGVVLGAEISRFLTPVVQVTDKTGGQLLINCVLPRSQSLNLSDYKSGERVQVSGRFHGFFSNAVVLKNCRADKI